MLKLTNLSLGMMISFVTLVSTLYITYYLIKRLKKRGFTVKDMYKKDRPDIASLGGLGILAGMMIAIVMTQLLVDAIDIQKFLIFYMVIIIYAAFGLMDDLIDINRTLKVIAPFFMALPIALVTVDTNISMLGFSLELGWLYPFIFAPLYVMVVSNLINMHSGYNGLSGGLTLIIIAFAAVKLMMDGPLRLLFYVIPLFFALLGFMWYNKHPSKVFLGNVGTTLAGAGAGALLVLFNMEFFGIIILIPHIINFLLWIFWSGILMRFWPEKYPHIKFGKIRKDGTIEAPNWLTVKYMAAKLFRVTEIQATFICYGLTIAFGVVGLFVG